MDWMRLLSSKRIDHNGNVSESPPDEYRSEYQRDSDRILFSTAFRRLHDKTQVFALPENDHVHSRLTHSLIVSSIGKSLGIAVGKYVIEKESSKNLPENITKYDFGEIVASACLAHDIGNPPFGHSGEDAIASFFRQYFVQNPSTLEKLDDDGKQRLDLENFEGNAQGLRLLTRSLNSFDSGLKLTAATLASFSKYPCESYEPKVGKKRAKFGFMQSEKDIFCAIARNTGLREIPNSKNQSIYCRHPLSYLVEAADDITYLILDIEDGVHLGYVKASEAISILREIAKEKTDVYRDRGFDRDRDKLAYLRGIAIRQLRDEVYHVFTSSYKSIMEGKFTGSLVENSRMRSRNNLKELHAIVERNCYRQSKVLQIELAGYEVLGGLLAAMVPAAVNESPSQRQEKILSMINSDDITQTGDIYGKILRVTDYLSGMTDSYALNLYRSLAGTSLPSGR